MREELKVALSVVGIPPGIAIHKAISLKVKSETSRENRKEPVGDIHIKRKE
jgi:hypothetical protein